MPHSAQTAEINTFATLGLDQMIVQQLAAQQITEPTPVQAQAIPELLAGHDLMVSAQTGTGKTAAFLLPALQRLLQAPKNTARGPRLLVLTPTRELAEQVAKVATEFCRRIPKCKVASFVGGVPYPVQNKLLSQPLEVMVATPGRLNDLIRGGRVDFRRLEMLVLDEADRMLDMGFIHDVKRIIAVLPAKRQSLFFSATMPPSIVKLAGTILTKPAQVTVTPVSSTVDTIDQLLIYVEKIDKGALLVDLIERNKLESVLVFTRTKHGADKVSKALGKKQIRSEAIHGNKSQNARQRALTQFKNRQIQVLVATDIAARGIDVDNLACVVNFEIPNVPETYVHRIGRTGRAGAAGKAFSFCETTEKPYIRDIEKLIGRKIPVGSTSLFSPAQH